LIKNQKVSKVANSGIKELNINLDYLNNKNNINLKIFKVKKFENKFKLIRIRKYQELKFLRIKESENKFRLFKNQKYQVLNISRIIKDLKICSNYLNKKNLIS
jgi:hypothetical protein